MMASSAATPATSGPTSAGGVAAQRSTPRLLAPSSLSFRAPHKSNLAASAASPRFQVTCHDQLTVVKAQMKEVLIQDPVASINKSDIPEPEAKEVNSSNQSASSTPFSDSSISEFMAEVASLVKLVDSRDIVELQLKQQDFEVVIRKKESFPPPSPSPLVMMHSPPSPQIVAPSQLPPAPAPLTPSAPVPPVVVKSSPKSSHPPLKCPMAGTFYRSPAPGEPAFVKVGDKVKKGQVLCIIEAMKLMNEIEADQAGTVVEILVDDGKPVSVDMPLFVIET